MIDAGIWESGFWLAVIAHGLIGITLVWDKVLLEHNRSASVVNYVFWLGALSSSGVLLAFFGIELPGIAAIALAMSAGTLHLIAIYFYYFALNSGEATETLAIIGGFSPIATALAAWPLLDSSLSGFALWGFAAMSAGGFVMFVSERFSMRRMLPPVLLSSALLGLSNVLQKMAFNRTSGFVTGYVFYAVGTFVCAMAFLARAKWRADIFSKSQRSRPKNRILYLSNRGLAGLGSLLVYLAISRTNPATVEAISGLRYVIIFVVVYGLTKFRPQWLTERFGGWPLAAKVVGTLLVVAGLLLSGLSGHEATEGATAERHPPGLALM